MSYTEGMDITRNTGGRYSRNGLARESRGRNMNPTTIELEEDTNMLTGWTYKPSDQDMVLAYLAGIRANVKQAKTGDTEALDMILLKTDWIWKYVTDHMVGIKVTS